MVKVVISGATAGLAREVIDKLVEDQKHEVVALSRRDPSTFPPQAGVRWAQTTYEDKAELVALFAGAEVVLDFIIGLSDPENKVTHRLIDAAVEAGVRRFAPSEWAMGQKMHDIIDSVPWYQGKVDTQKYLRQINKDKKVIEYCFFQVGMYMETAAFPRKVARHVPAVPAMWQLDALRVVGIRGHEDAPITVTSTWDIACVVRRAIEYEGVWPEVGGIQGTQTSVLQMKNLVERVRGQPVRMDIVDPADLDAGRLTVDMPRIDHPSIPPEQRDSWYVFGWVGTLKAAACGAWSVTDEWNKLLPDYKFKSLETFIRETWQQ